MTTRPRLLRSCHCGMPASDGAGVKLIRLLGTPELPELDPFLMLDQFHSDRAEDYIAGFPDHPHRGFETVTIMFAGRMRHGDNQGHSGVIGPGGLQWMTAGRGIIHSELPEQENGLMWGFQLWINLPAAQKMIEPGYQEFTAEEIPVEQYAKGGTVRVLAGTLASGLQGAARSAATEPLLLDIQLPPRVTLAEAIPVGHQALIAVYEGAVRLIDQQSKDTTVEAATIGVLDDGDSVEITAGEAGAGLLLIAAAPLGEPVARYGPFVMNTQAELQQAVLDFQQEQF